MKRQKPKSNVQAILLTGTMTMLSLTCVARILHIICDKPIDADTIVQNQLETMLPDLTPNEGNNYGAIYTLDGKAMYTVPDTEAIEKQYLPEVCYSNIVGYPNQSGLMKEAEYVLLANADDSNKKKRRGNTIITTIVSDAQKTATEELIEYNTDDAWASLVVVSADGAVLVNAGSNAHDPILYYDYLEELETYKQMGDASKPEPQPPEAAYLNYGFSAALVGSSFKPIVARMMLQNNDLFNDEYSLYNETFEDVSYYAVNNQVIHNHDFQNSGAYEVAQGDVCYRRCSLSLALIHSSNTYFLRHAQKLGFTTTERLLNDMFFLNLPIFTETNTLEACIVQEERLPWLSFGQDASIAPVRLANMYNLAIGGKMFVPFTIAQVRTPDNEILFETNPKERTEYAIAINMENDLLIQALSETFQSYNKTLAEDFPEELLSSGRILSKSGTAEIDTETNQCNRTMAVTILNEEKTAVICSAVLAVNHCNGLNNEDMVRKLLKTLDTLEVL